MRRRRQRGDSYDHSRHTSRHDGRPAHGYGRIKFPITEPADGKKKSQIEEYFESLEIEQAKRGNL